MFSGNLRYIPTNSAELNGYLQNVPQLPNKINSYLGMKYGDITFKKNLMDRHVFGLGREYSDNITFLNQVNQAVHNGNAQKTAAFETTTKGISNLNQLTMESGYMDPMSYFTLMENYKREISNIGIDNAITGGTTIFGDARNINPALAQNPLASIATGKHGISLDPMKMMGSYKMRMLMEFNKQAKEIIETQEHNGEKWLRNFEQEESGGFWCKQGGTDCR